MRGPDPHAVTLESGPTTIPGDSALARRLRREQAKYRAEVLGLPSWGQTPRGRPLGCILSRADADAGHNFLSFDALELYEHRRTLGWGVDPTRITAHMTSSQALLFNLFGVLAGDDAWLSRALRELLRRPDIRGVSSVQLEYAPRRISAYLSDHTIIDALIWLETSGGPEALAVEVKYGDRFSTRRVPFNTNPQYIELARVTGTWSIPLTELAVSGTNQLTRIHALALRAAQISHPGAPCSVLVITHPDDASALSAVGLYRSVTTQSHRVHALGLDDALRALSATAPDGQDGRVESFWDRYLPPVHETELDLAEQHASRFRRAPRFLAMGFASAALEAATSSG
jgi:hypothetical protein